MLRNSFSACLALSLSAASGAISPSNQRPAAVRYSCSTQSRTDPRPPIELLPRRHRLPGPARQRTLLPLGPSDGPAQGAAPAARRLVGVFRPAVDHQRAQPAVMHRMLLSVTAPRPRRNAWTAPHGA